MSKIITVPFTEDFIDHLADYIHQNYILKGIDLRKLAVIFGGRRPALFLKRALAARSKKVFYPPTFFTIDEWMAHIVASQKETQPLSGLDHYYLIYQLALKHTPELLKGRERFCSFLPWAKEIHALIEQLDLELTSQNILKNLQAQAQIGFDIPKDISRLLESLFVLRREYHQLLEQQNITSRGFQYSKASQLVASCDLSGWQEILFCNFFYLHRSEMKTIEYCYKHANTTLMMQGDQRRWPALKRISSVLGGEILEGPKVIEGDFKLKIHKAFDIHSQAAMVKNILEKVSQPERTVIVLPQTDFILPLLSLLSDQVKEFNISMGYPLKRSALYALLEKIFAAQKSLQKNLYYTRDYLRVLRHPLVQNLEKGGAQVVRVLVHTIEEILTGQVESQYSGQIFLNLEAFAQEEKLIERSLVALKAIDIDITPQNLKETLKFLHQNLFYQWQKAASFGDLAQVLGDFTSLMRQGGSMSKYPFNDRIALSLENLSQELAASEFAKQSFLPHEMFRILEDTLSNQMVAFTGSPLRGLQILGLFETRALSFENVIVVDVNEGILPNLNIYEPLIPRDIMIKLNLDRLELEEEIQRYGFMRLISSARNVHLIYQERADKQRSRFIEELIWEEEKKAQKLDVVTVESGRFQVKLNSTQKIIPKTQAMVDFLKTMSFSASSLNTYLRNPYEFYENYVLGLREQDNLLDEPEARHIGNFVHELLEDTFKSFINKKPILDEEFRKYFLNVSRRKFEEIFGRRQRSDAFLIKSVLETRLQRFLDVEALRCHKEVATILALERRFDHVTFLGDKQVRLTYRMDRVDQMTDGSILVLDYKTGGQELIPKSFDELLEGHLSREIIRDQLLSFQMPLYLYYLQGVYPNVPINAALYHLKTNKIEKFIKGYSLEDSKQAIDAGLRSLGFILEEILDPQIPFVDDPQRNQRD